MSQRIRGQDITPKSHTPFMTQHAARVWEPLAELVDFPELFLSVSSNLRAGDQVDLCRFDTQDMYTARVLEYATVLITNKTPLAVEFRLLGSIFEVDAAKPEPAAADERPLLEVANNPEGPGLVVRDANTGYIHKHFMRQSAAERYAAEYGRAA